MLTITSVIRYPSTRLKELEFPARTDFATYVEYHRARREIARSVGWCARCTRRPRAGESTWCVHCAERNKEVKSRHEPKLPT